MMAKNNTRNLSKIILMSSLITGLSACNHNDDDKLLARDSTPIDFSLTAEQVSNLNPGQSIYSGVVNIYGVDVGTRTQVRITGGEYSVITEPGTFNVADLTFTSEPSTALLGNRVVVKATSSEQFEDSHAVILEVGGVSSEMLLTTRPRDESPDAFTIAEVYQVDFGTVITSEEIRGLTAFDAAPISISNGKYCIDTTPANEIATCDDANNFVDTTGTITLGDSLWLQVTSAEIAATSTTATVTIGSTQATLTATTFSPDETAPEVAVQFPPANSMTMGDSIIAYGMVADGESNPTQVVWHLKDALGTEIDSGTIDAPELAASWEWQTPALTLTSDDTYTLSFSARNDGGFRGNAPEYSVTLKRDSAGGSFPDATTPMSFVRQIAYDESNNRLLMADSGVVEAVMAMDLSTGARSQFALPPGGGLNTRGIVVHGDFAYVSSRQNKTINQYPLSNTDPSSKGTEWAYRANGPTAYKNLLSEELAIDPVFNRIFISEATGNGGALFSAPLPTLNPDGSVANNGGGDMESSRYDSPVMNFEVASMAAVPGVGDRSPMLLFSRQENPTPTNDTSGTAPDIFSLPLVNSATDGGQKAPFWQELTKAPGDDLGGRPVSIVYDSEAGADRLLVAVKVGDETAADKIMAIDINTQVASDISVGGDNPIANTDSLLRVPGVSYLFVSDTDTLAAQEIGNDAILAVDLKTGQRVYLSKN